MEDRILDAEGKKRKRYTVKSMAIKGGLLSFASTALVMSTVFFCPIDSKLLNHPLTFYIVLLSILTPALIIMSLMAAYGNRNGHFMKILFSGLLCWQTTILTVFLIGNLLTISEEEVQTSIKSTIIMDLFELNIVIFILAFIFWLIPGKLPYFRKQIEL